MIMNAYRTSTLIPKTALNGSWIFIFNEATTYGALANVSCLAELILAIFRYPKDIKWQG